jgi:hypothetical protein
VPGHDAPGRHPQRPRRFHIGQLADDQRRGAHDAGEARRIHDAERDDDRRERGPERCNKRDREQDVREGHHGVDDAGDRRIEPPEETCNEAERHADDGCKDNDRRPNQKGEPARIDRAGEDVAPEFVGSKPEQIARRLKTVHDRQAVRRIGRDQRRQHS